MTTNIIPFQFESIQVRTITDEQGDPWFVLRDLLDAMQSKTTTNNALESIKTGLGEGYSNGIPLETEGGTQEVIIVAEAAATYLLSRSNTETGRRLNRFVHVDILPALRKTGRYQIPAEPTITPAQQRQLQNAIAERFPEGKHRPYAWSRFNNHFHLGSYKQLPGTQVEEALAYIAQMETKGTDATDRERLAREALQFGRFVLTFDHRGMMLLMEVPPLARMITDEEMVKLVAEPGEFKRDLLPALIENAARRLKG